MTKQIKSNSSTQSGAVNPMIVILVLLMGIFIAVIVLFIRQMIEKQQPLTATLSETETLTDYTQTNLNPIPSSDQLATLSGTATPTATVTPAAGNRTIDTQVNSASNSSEAKSPTATTNVNSAVTAKATATPTPVTSKTTTTTATNTGSKTYIKGELTLQGDIPANASILVLQRKTGESNYQVITRVNAQRTLTWEWNDAVAGTKYDITYALQVDNSNIHTAPVATAIAPARVNTRMNTTSNPNQTSITSPNASNLSRPWLASCGTKNDNKFGATIKLPYNSNAKNYKILIGTSLGGTEITSTVLSAVGSEDISYHLDFENDKTYFVRYAIDLGNGQYSDHSATVEMRCKTK